MGSFSLTRSLDSLLDLVGKLRNGCFLPLTIGILEMKRGLVESVGMLAVEIIGWPNLLQ